VDGTRLAHILGLPGSATELDEVLGGSAWLVVGANHG